MWSKDHDNKVVRRNALSALARIVEKDDAQTVATLSACTQDVAWEVRAAAVVALSQIVVTGHTAAVIAVGARLTDTDANVRRAAVQALPQMSRKSGTPQFC